MILDHNCIIIYDADQIGKLKAHSCKLNNNKIKLYDRFSTNNEHRNFRIHSCSSF